MRDHAEDYLTAQARELWDRLTAARREGGVDWIAGLVVPDSSVALRGVERALGLADEAHRLVRVSPGRWRLKPAPFGAS